MAPVNNIERRAAKKLAASDGINYTEALRRIRNSGISPSAVVSGHAVSVTQGVSTVDKAMEAIATLGGTILKDNPLDYRALLTELLESKTHANLESNISIVLSKGTATGQAKALNALVRDLAQWESEQHFREVDIKKACTRINASIVASWSLGNLLEEMDLAVPLAGSLINLDAEKDWTELSSRVEAAIQTIPDFEAEGISIRLLSRGMAALGLASLHGVKKWNWLMIRSGWGAKVSIDQQMKIEKYGKGFVFWAGAADNVEEIIRAAEASRSLDPEVIKLVIAEG